MKNKTHLLFDLDGTLTDPGTGITKSVQYALSSFGIDVEDRHTLFPYIGPPLHTSFMEYHGLSADQAEKAIEKYREYFSTTGIFENELFEGVPEMLQQLKDAGKTLLVATSKPEKFAKMILDHFQIGSYFTFVGGARMDGINSEKDQIIKYVMESCALQDPDSLLMIGDRKYDIMGARAHGLDSVGVLFGYGDLEELKSAGASHIVSSMEELTQLLLSL